VSESRAIQVPVAAEAAEEAIVPQAEAALAEADTADNIC